MSKIRTCRYECKLMKSSTCVCNHNLSLQRWTDQEITDYLREKGTDIARTKVNSIKNQIEKKAENWYIELRESRYKFIATYKERLDSLLLYQKKLNGILDSSKKEETKIAAITALQSIEPLP